jgi:hypothetical protein
MDILFYECECAQVKCPDTWQDAIIKTSWGRFGSLGSGAAFDLFKIMVEGTGRHGQTSQVAHGKT